MLQQIRRTAAVSLGALVLFISACKKDNDPKPIPPAQGNRLVKIAQGPNDYTSFTYNADGTLKTMTESMLFDNGPTVSTLTLTYGADKKLSEGLYTGGSKIKFLYENGKLSRTELANNLGELLNISLFEYNTAGRLKTYTVLGKVSPVNDPVLTYKPILKTEYTYFTVHDSLVHEAVSYKRNGNTQQLEKWSVFRWDAYDEQKNPLTQLGDFGIALFRHSSRNNATDEYLYDEDMILLEHTENEYTYNNNGYPVTNKQKVRDPQGPTPSYYNITYTYQ
jgi:hypothetical protein